MSGVYCEARYGGQSGIRCTAREPHAEQTNRPDRVSAMNGVDGVADRMGEEVAAHAMVGFQMADDSSIFRALNIFPTPPGRPVIAALSRPPCAVKLR